MINTLTRAEKNLIWIPKIIFNNTDDENGSLVDDKAAMAVIRKVGRSGGRRWFVPCMGSRFRNCVSESDTKIDLHFPLLKDSEITIFPRDQGGAAGKFPSHDN